VLNNRDLNQVTWEQRVLTGDPKLEASQTLPDFPYAAYARSIGLDGVRIDDPGQIRGAWKRAFAADVPFVLEAITDPEVPPLPPHISFDQARKLGTALAKGDPGRAEIVKESVKALLKR